MTPDRPVFAAADRNKHAILDVLRRILPETGTVLEIASGGGQHVAHFARAMPSLGWLPSDADAELVEHLAEMTERSALENLLAPLYLDMLDAAWAEYVTHDDLTAVINANMIHISPCHTCLNLFEGAADLLPAGGLVSLYGPFVVDGEYSSDGNRDFDSSLRAQNLDWGLRELNTVCEVAGAAGFEHTETIEMPVNNLTVVFRRVGTN